VGAPGQGWKLLFDSTSRIPTLSLMRDYGGIRMLLLRGSRTI